MRYAHPHKSSLPVSVVCKEPRIWSFMTARAYLRGTRLISTLFFVRGYHPTRTGTERGHVGTTMLGIVRYGDAECGYCQARRGEVLREGM
eukprot:3940313-Rhodomonas_salina.2